MIKESACKCRRCRFISESRRSLGGGKSNPLQYSWLEKCHGLRSLAGYSPWGRKESGTSDWLNNKRSLQIMEKPLIRYGICKYFLSFCGLSFHLTFFDHSLFLETQFNSRLPQQIWFSLNLSIFSYTLPIFFFPVGSLIIHSHFIVCLFPHTQKK